MSPRPAKILHLALALALALAADLVRGLSGAEAAAAMVSQRTGTYFDPHVAEAYLDHIGAELADQEGHVIGGRAAEQEPGAVAHSASGRPGGTFTIRAHRYGTTCINAEVEDQGSTRDGNLTSARSPGGEGARGRGREGRGRAK